MLGDGDVEWWEGVRLLHAYTVTPADTHITHTLHTVTHMTGERAD